MCHVLLITNDRISLWFLSSLVGKEHFARLWCSDWGRKWGWPLHLVWKQQQLDLCPLLGELPNLSEPNLSNGAMDTYMVLPRGWEMIHTGCLALCLARRGCSFQQCLPWLPCTWGEWLWLQKVGIVEAQSPGSGAGGGGGWRFILLLLLWIEWRKSPWKPAKRKKRMTLLLPSHLSSFLLFCPIKVLAVSNSQDFPSLQPSSLPWQVRAVCLWGA